MALYIIPLMLKTIRQFMRKIRFCFFRFFHWLFDSIVLAACWPPFKIRVIAKFLNSWDNVKSRPRSNWSILMLAQAFAWSDVMTKCVWIKYSSILVSRFIRARHHKPFYSHEKADKRVMKDWTKPTVDGQPKEKERLIEKERKIMVFGLRYSRSPKIRSKCHDVLSQCSSKWCWWNYVTHESFYSVWCSKKSKNNVYLPFPYILVEARFASFVSQTQRNRNSYKYINVGVKCDFVVTWEAYSTRNRWCCIRWQKQPRHSFRNWTKSFSLISCQYFVPNFL